jgi:orotidine-5'-phosphate decarboxylase
MKSRSNPVYCGIDTIDLAQATRLIQSIAGGPKPAVGGIKLGLEFFLAHGAPGVRYAFPAPVRATGVGFFLDLKLHDIPNTVAKAVASAGELGVAMLTLHLTGGRRMLDAAVKECPPDLLLLGVTVLTSSDADTLSETGIESNVEEQTLRLAALGAAAGIRGLIASPHEVRSLRNLLGRETTIITPGVRPSWSAADDQKRFTTPCEAVENGADYLVIGRPITAAQDPREAADRIVSELT